MQTYSYYKEIMDRVGCLIERTWGVVGLDGQQHLQVRLLAQCGNNIYVLYEYDMTTYLLMLLVDAAAGTLSVASSKDPQSTSTEDLLGPHTKSP